MSCAQSVNGKRINLITRMTYTKILDYFKNKSLRLLCLGKRSSKIWKEVWRCGGFGGPPPPPPPKKKGEKKEKGGGERIKEKGDI